MRKYKIIEMLPGSSQVFYTAIKKIGLRLFSINVNYNGSLEVSKCNNACNNLLNYFKVILCLHCIAFIIETIEIYAYMYL